MTTAVALKVIVVDYGAGNLRSVARAVAHAGFEPDVTSDPRALADAGALIVPGVGAAADTMRNLKASGMVEPIRDYIASGRPFLGVCMGQQALLSVSEEGGEHACLDVIPGRVKKLRPNVPVAEGDPPPASDLQPPASGLKIPHMGWNTVRQLPGSDATRSENRPHPIFEGIPDDAYFYFVHSYAPEPDDPSVVIGETTYGAQTFASVLARDSIVATQFHPEKSSDHGLRLYANFLKMAGSR